MRKTKPRNYIYDYDRKLGNYVKRSIKRRNDEKNKNGGPIELHSRYITSPIRYHFSVSPDIHPIYERPYNDNLQGKKKHTPPTRNHYSRSECTQTPNNMPYFLRLQPYSATIERRSYGGPCEKRLRTVNVVRFSRCMAGY